MSPFFRRITIKSLRPTPFVLMQDLYILAYFRISYDTIFLSNLKGFAPLTPAVVPRWRQSAATSVVAKFLEVCVRYIKAHSQLVAQFLHVMEERFFNLAVQSEVAARYTILLVELHYIEAAKFIQFWHESLKRRTSFLNAKELCAQCAGSTIRCSLD